ncbi:MAG: thioredoxin, partial [Flavipsychrobacter sp.]|nr:thioredoxin [Flavipsychrobacter sp.]
GEQVFNGQLTFEDLDREKTFDWFKKGRDEYNPDPRTMIDLRPKLAEYSMVVFLGTWCDDSHVLVPKLERVMAMANYPVRQIAMYGTDREKTTKNGEQKKYKVTLVPTVILLKDNKEVGRITETVQKSVEADLLAIIEKDKKQ